MQAMSRWGRSRNLSSAHTRTTVARHGLWTLTAAKFLPGTVVPSLAGALGMSARRFLLFDGLAALFYAGCYITAGFLFHNQVELIMVVIDRVCHGVIGLGVVLVAGYVGWKYALRRRSTPGKSRSSNSPDEQTDLPDTDTDVVTQVEAAP